MYVHATILGVSLSDKVDWCMRVFLLRATVYHMHIVTLFTKNVSWSMKCPDFQWSYLFIEVLMYEMFCSSHPRIFDVCPIPIQ